nr:hypothetical protein [uncultured Mediterranean phage uvMED]BAR28388.1 hypothetical protein [uncultured Mediterranean phage uvMED]
MPKIPTFQAKGRITAEAGAVRTNIQVSPFQTTAGELSKVAKVAEDYYIKQRDNNEKIAAKKKYYEMKSESDRIIESQKNNGDEFESVGIYRQEFGDYRKQQLSQIKNKRIKKRLETLLDIEQPENVYTIKKNSFKAMEADSNQIYTQEQNSLGVKRTLETDSNKKKQIQNQQIESAREYENIHGMGEAWLNEETKKIIGNNELFDVEKAVAKKDYGTALNLLKQSTSINQDDVEKQVIKIQKEGEEYRATSYGVSQILQGNNPTLGKKIPGTTDEKILEATDALLFNKAAANNLNPTDTFRLVDDAFAPTGLISPYYEELFEAGFNAGSITTFDTAADIPAVVIQSVKAAEAADKLGRLSVYTTEKEQEFFDNVIVAKEILGMNNYEAIKNAKEFQMNYDKAVMQGATKQKTKTFENLETFFKDKPWSLRDREITNIGEVKSYVDKIFNMYLAMNIDSKKAQQLTVNNIKKNLEVVDSYLYKKRDIDSFKSIGGLDMVKPVKTYIIKNNMIDEDPKDFYLRYNGGGIFEIRNRVDTSQVYDKNNNPMIYYAKDLYAINQEREFKFRSEVKKETQLEQEKKIKFKEEFEPLFGDSTGF